MGRFRLIWLFLFLPIAAPAMAQPQRNLESRAVASEQRVALVIGNAAYKEGPLRNSANDATDIAAALKRLGFNVILRTNADRRQMVEGVRQFGSQIKRGGVGFFYYAGHGIQSRGRNFLIPIGARLESESDLEFESVDANMVLAQMDEAANRVNIVVLDACRDNPFARSFRSAARGLAQMDSARGTFLAYATSPGSVAADGSGRNGTYTKHLLASLGQPDSKLEEVFKRVRVGVAQETNNRQIPWDASSVLGEFHFRTASHVAASAPAVPGPATPPAAEQIASVAPSIGDPIPELGTSAMNVFVRAHVGRWCYLSLVSQTHETGDRLVTDNLSNGAKYGEQFVDLSTVKYLGSEGSVYRFEYRSTSIAGGVKRAYVQTVAVERDLDRRKILRRQSVDTGELLIHDATSVSGGNPVAYEIKCELPR